MAGWNGKSPDGQQLIVCVPRRRVTSATPLALKHAFPLSAQGERVFQREGCRTCHTPPWYTNNKLLPVRGFAVPAGHRNTYDISTRTIDTDPALTMETRRGTGYYKVP